MVKKIIYSCIFFNKNYIELVKLLLKSYKLFGNASQDIDYLIICDPDYKTSVQRVFDSLNMNGKIWCLDLKTKFEAGYSRLKIFQYPEIHLYDTILYLDCDILILNDIGKVLDIPLENKIYAVKEKMHRIHHCQFFSDEEYKLVNTNSAFSSGIMYFNNCEKIKTFFSNILLDIYRHLSENKTIPHCLDQPFIVYRAIKEDIYNNQSLHGIATNTPQQLNSDSSESICHFSNCPGHYESKVMYMRYIMDMLLLNNTNYIKPLDVLVNKIYKWNNFSIEFLENGNMKPDGIGKYYFLDKHLVKCYISNREHVLKFDKDYTFFISVRKGDFEVINGVIV
tara:strand:+ start:566 stop:1576 length:1011 start_codon:yes stop_codon:yes gene_type:complete